MLYLALTVICIFYLIVISIDWYDGVIRFSETFYRQIAIDGRYRDFPIWSFVIPSIVLMAWKTLTIVRSEPASRADRWAKALSFGRLLGYDGSKGFVRMDRSYSRVRPILPEIALSFLLIFWAIVMVVTEGAIKLHDGGAGGFVAVDGGRWVIGTLFWNTQADWFGTLAVLMADSLSRDHLCLAARATGRTAAGLLYQQVVGAPSEVRGGGDGVGGPQG